MRLLGATHTKPGRAFFFADRNSPYTYYHSTFGDLYLDFILDYRRAGHALTEAVVQAGTVCPGNTPMMVSGIEPMTMIGMTNDR